MKNFGVLYEDYITEQYKVVKNLTLEEAKKLKRESDNSFKTSIISFFDEDAHISKIIGV